MALVDDTRTERSGADPEALIREARELQRRRVRRRAIGALLGVLLLGAGGIAVFGGGSAPAGVVLHGPLPAGIAARAADPSGGLPWGIRVVRRGGWTCVQLGRLRGNQLGLLGRDGTAGNDGRFHPFGPSTSYQARCVRQDGHGHAFMTVELGAQPASGAGGGYTGMSQCRTADQVAGFKRVLRRIGRVPPGVVASQLGSVCPPGDLRFIQYGLLGPDATSVSYALTGATVLELTHGSDGAYLVVAPSTPSFCASLPRSFFCGGTGVAPNAIAAG